MAVELAWAEAVEEDLAVQAVLQVEELDFEDQEANAYVHAADIENHITQEYLVELEFVLNVAFPWLGLRLSPLAHLPLLLVA